MTQAAYVPMHPPQKEVSQDRMKQILAKHTPKVEVTGDVGSGAVTHSEPSLVEAQPVPALKWERISPWYMRSTDGMYRCRKYIPDEVRLLGHNEQPKYQLEKKVGEVWFYRFGPPFESWDEARAAAEADARAK